ncbi:hypothetical protein GOBAR_DD03819 [Gossypium barbadense]|nr:hypothetical protein GOBAR_DD03819 [Gossypium barbadense]
MLTQDDAAKEDIPVLPIVGIRGLGKTALTKLVFNDATVDAHFELKQWVCVFVDFDLKGLMKGKEKQHPNLVKIGQAIMKKCQGIPLVVKDLGGNGLQHLKSLQLLVIYGCPNLKYLFQEIQELTSPNTLVIAACKNLVSLPLGLENLTALQYLIITDCEQLDLSRTQGFQEKIEKVEEDGFSLLSLGIVNLPKLGALPQWLLRGSTNTLKNLTIADCVNLTTSVEWHNLTSLEKLAIIHCPQLLSLPNNMQRLKQLKIEYCPLLSQRCQQGTGELVVIPKYCRCKSQKLSRRGVVGFQRLLIVRKM